MCYELIFFTTFVTLKAIHNKAYKPKKNLKSCVLRGIFYLK